VEKRKDGKKKIVRELRMQRVKKKFDSETVFCYDFPNELTREKILGIRVGSAPSLGDCPAFEIENDRLQAKREKNRLRSYT
jgi:hypothetical protein